MANARPPKAAGVVAGGEWEIRYEVVLLGQFALRWADRQLLVANGAPRAPDDTLDYTAVLEALLLHARGVTEFLTDGSRGDTRSAVSFASTWNLQAECKTLKPTIYRLNKELAHLDVNRSAQTWDPVAIADEVVGRFEAFLKKLDQPCDSKMLIGGTTISRSAITRAQNSQTSLPPELREHRP